MTVRFYKHGPAATAAGLLLLMVTASGCQSAQAFSNRTGVSGAYGEVDLVRLRSHQPPPSSNRDADRYFQENY